ncbi:MAG: TonB-dependent receptor [bacterium]|nr:TonB-dependent receptor [bacterium]
MEKTKANWSGRFFRLAVILLLPLALSGLAITSNAAEMGKIAGQIVNAATGETLIGATITVKGTELGAMTDLDGNYLIKSVPAGTYTLVISSIAYTPVEITSVIVTAGETNRINTSLKEQAHQVQGVKIEARAVQNTEATMLVKRQKAAAVSDAISAEQISRSGSGNAAEAMAKVTGASVVGGKFVYIRGLGDRYSSTKLNGSVLPSPDPDKQSMPIDIIPSSLLDNIIVEKTFTPDKPGDFAGGSVNLGTKDYPDERTLKFSSSTGYNSNTNGDSDFLYQTPSSKDWLGYDDGSRSLPDYIRDNADLQDRVNEEVSHFVTFNEDSRDSLFPLVVFMDSSTRAFSTEMKPQTKKAPLDQGHSISYGDQFRLFDRPLGITGSLSYGRSYQSYVNGFDGKYKLAGGQGSQGLTVDHELRDWQGIEEVLWGGLLSANVGVHRNHKLGATFSYTRNGESTSRYLTGINLEHLDSGQTLRTYAMTYSERKLNSLQFTGKHHLPQSLLLEWVVSDANTNQYEPDTRFFTDYSYWESYEDDETGELIDTLRWDIDPNRFPTPQRLWRELDESNREYRADLSIPVTTQIKGKVGFAAIRKERSSREDRYRYSREGSNDYDGEIDVYASDVGIDTSWTTQYGNTTYIFRNYIKNAYQDRNQYTGEKNVDAVYGMVDLPQLGQLRVITGLRYETTYMETVSQDSTVGTLSNDGTDGNPRTYTYGPGISRIEATDILPSVNLIYALNDNMNTRFAYGRTLARPTLREMSAAASEEFGVSRFFLGNPNIRQTYINNLDFRWEWFIRPGEVLAVSAFHKSFTDHIEHGILITSANGNLSPINVDEATVLGVEVEFRRRLDHVGSLLRNFVLGGNVTLAKSEVAIPEDEMLSIKEFDPNASSTRPMAGQSPYLINLDLGYSTADNGLRASLFYNVFGRRLAFNAMGKTPNVYEMPRHQVDLVVSKSLLFGATLNFKAKNLLDEDVRFVHDNIGLPDGVEYVYREHRVGRSFSIGMDYQVW